MAKQKFYVVWAGHEPGVYSNWNKCKAQIDGFPKALYKSFATLAEAEKAYQESSFDHIGKDKKPQKTVISEADLSKYGQPEPNSISVDGAWNTKTGKTEYQGVYTETKERIFHAGPFDDGTNNIAEFLAIVHALAYCKQKRISLPIYSDSKTAISWVRQKTAKTNHPRSAKNVKLFELLERAEQWLKSNRYDNEIRKWETKVWGENPADFGRK